MPQHGVFLTGLLPGSTRPQFLEILGTYNPIPDPFGNKQVTLKVDKVNKW